MNIIRKYLVLFVCLFIINTTIVMAAENEDKYSKKSDPKTIYEMIVCNKSVGYVRFAARGLAVYDDVVNKIVDKYNGDAEIEFCVSFRTVLKDKISTEVQLANNIEQAIIVKVDACSINVDNQNVCYVKDLKVANEILDMIKDPYKREIETNELTDLISIAFKQDITLNNEVVDSSLIMSKYQAASTLTKDICKPIEYTICDGDSLWSIARMFDVSVSKISEYNPKVNEELIHPGDKIKISNHKQLLTVITKERVKETKEIPFETEIKKDANLELGKTKVVEEGQKGKKEVLLYITKEEGNEISREIIEEKIVEEPKERVEIRGTKVVSKPSNNYSRGSANRENVVAFAKQQLGKPYVYGANGPNSFDCSGFTSYVFKSFGISIPRVSRYQVNAGSPVSRSSLAQGDLILFTSPNSGSSIGHVGIYIGGGKFIHASSGSKHSVCISSLNSTSYSRRYVCARRLLN